MECMEGSQRKNNNDNIKKKAEATFLQQGFLGWGHTLHTVGRGHPDHQSLLGTGVIRDKSS